MKRFFCDDEMTTHHEPRKWEVKEKEDFYQVVVLKCKFCGKELREEVIK